jgi:hypothetical protein
VGKPGPNDRKIVNANITGVRFTLGKARHDPEGGASEFRDTLQCWIDLEYREAWPEPSEKPDETGFIFEDLYDHEASGFDRFVRAHGGDDGYWPEVAKLLVGKTVRIDCTCQVVWRIGHAIENAWAVTRNPQYAESYYWMERNKLEEALAEKGVEILYCGWVHASNEALGGFSPDQMIHAVGDLDLLGAVVEAFEPGTAEACEECKKTRNDFNICPALKKAVEEKQAKKKRGKKKQAKKR